MTWHHRAACKGLTELFYGNQTDDAVAACEQCPVSDECLLDALEVERRQSRVLRFGIRAGLTADERTAMIDELDIEDIPAVRAECGTTGGYQRHRYDGEETCAACKRAHAAATRERDRKRRKKAA